MGSALSSVFGGGGLSSLLNIASMFFPPLAIVNSLSNLLTGVLGQALKAGIETLTKEFGMPKFIGDIANKAIDTVVGQNQKESSSEVDSHIAEQAGDQVKSWGNDFQKDFVERTMDKVKAKRKSGADGKEQAPASSWLMCIAEAMGEAMAAKAGKMIDLSAKIKELSSKEIDPKDTNAQKKNAGEMNVANSQLNAAGKEFELLTNTMKSVVDSIGNSLAQAARKG
jgi:hypothetical protein